MGKTLYPTELCIIVPLWVPVWLSRADMVFGTLFKKEPADDISTIMLFSLKVVTRWENFCYKAKCLCNQTSLLSSLTQNIGKHETAKKVWIFRIIVLGPELTDNLQ